MNNISPTIFHITHWKAGSQWVAEILKQSAPERFVPWKINNPHAHGGLGVAEFYVSPLVPGKIYGTVYLRKRVFRRVVFGLFWRSDEGNFLNPRRAFDNLWNYRIKRSPYRSFVIFRDLRDTLISFYFSTKYSHEASVSVMSERKQKLKSMDMENGLIYMLDEVLPSTAALQESWIGAKDALLLRYENILGNEYEFFDQLVDYCKINVSRERLHDIVCYNIFEAATGRKRGDQDVNAHLRKGIAGDWRNYFTERTKSEFKKRFGDVLIKTGYEQDLNW